MVCCAEYKRSDWICRSGIQAGSAYRCRDAPLGIQRDDIVVDFEVGDTIQVIAGAWADTVGVIQTINVQKQSLTINVELFGRETPVEISFAEVKKM